jgi:hypothetical protein
MRDCSDQFARVRLVDERITEDLVVSLRGPLGSRHAIWYPVELLELRRYNDTVVFRYFTDKLALRAV